MRVVRLEVITELDSRSLSDISPSGGVSPKCWSYQCLMNLLNDLIFFFSDLVKSGTVICKIFMFLQILQCSYNYFGSENNVGNNKFFQ